MSLPEGNSSTGKTEKSVKTWFSLSCAFIRIITIWVQNYNNFSICANKFLKIRTIYAFFRKTKYNKKAVPLHRNSKTSGKEPQKKLKIKN